MPSLSSLRGERSNRLTAPMATEHALQEVAQLDAMILIRMAFKDHFFGHPHHLATAVEAAVQATEEMQSLNAHTSANPKAT